MKCQYCNKTGMEVCTSCGFKARYTEQEYQDAVTKARRETFEATREACLGIVDRLGAGRGVWRDIRAITLADVVPEQEETNG